MTLLKVLIRAVFAIGCSGFLLVMLALWAGRLLPASQWFPFSLINGLNSDIYVFDMQHRLLVNLTRDTVWEDSPSLSRDGQRISFVRNHAGNFEMILTDLSGDDPLPVSQDKVSVASPVLSPDGSQIVFTMTSDRTANIYLLNLEDGARHRLTDNISGDKTPDWSPDGNWIAYGGLNGLDAIDAHCLEHCDSAAQHFGRDPHDAYPTWSPDGKYIAYLSEQGTGTGVFLVDTDCLSQKTSCAQRPQLLFGGNIQARRLIWSADGQQVIFSAVDAARLQELYAVPLDCDAKCQPIQLTALDRSIMGSGSP